MKETLRSELLHSVANALATRVFPVPNGRMEAREIQSSHQEAFGITWRTVEQQTARRSEIKFSIHVPVHQREQDHLLHDSNVLLQPSDAGEILCRAWHPSPFFTSSKRATFHFCRVWMQKISVTVVDVSAQIPFIPASWDDLTVGIVTRIFTRMLFSVMRTYYSISTLFLTLSSANRRKVIGIDCRIDMTVFVCFALWR